MNNAIAIAATEAKEAALKHTDLTEQIKAAMRVASNHWLITDENEQFQSAIAGVILAVDFDTQERIKKELNALRGLTIGNINGLDFEFEPIGLLKLWRQIKTG